MAEDDLRMDRKIVRQCQSNTPLPPSAGVNQKYHSYAHSGLTSFDTYLEFSVDQSLLAGSILSDRKLKRLEISNMINKDFELKIVNIFLSISLNICFGCSKQLSH